MKRLVVAGFLAVVLAMPAWAVEPVPTSSVAKAAPVALGHDPGKPGAESPHVVTAPSPTPVDDEVEATEVSSVGSYSFLWMVLAVLAVLLFIARRIRRD